MVECSNKNCLVQWFHFGCVGIKSAPRGLWYCPTCRVNAQHRRLDREVEIIGDVAAAPKTFKFCPVSWTWMRKKCDEFNIHLLGPQIKRQDDVIMKTALDSPSKKSTQSIVGDGNCLFRALSHVVSNTEENYQIMRYLICNQIDASPERYMESETSRKYFERTGMRKNYIWGTCTEIQAAADLLKTCIWVYGPQVGRNAWKEFKPKIRDSEVDGSIFITNRGLHYEPLYKWL